jgi:acyl carrier protein
MAAVQASRAEIEGDLLSFLRPRLGAGNGAGALASGEDLFAAGLDSAGTLELVDRVEAMLGTPIPMRLLTPANFTSVARIANLVLALRDGGTA